MLSLATCARLVTTCVLAVLFPTAVCGQTTGLTPSSPSLKLPTIVASAAAAADWASTYHALKYYHVREINPVLRRFDDSPGRLISIGAVIDVGAMSLWNVTLGEKHPRAAAAGLWTMAAFRAYLAIHNFRNEQKAAHR
jgi:hypothetical protein